MRQAGLSSYTEISHSLARRAVLRERELLLGEAKGSFEDNTPRSSGSQCLSPERGDLGRMHTDVGSSTQDHGTFSLLKCLLVSLRVFKNT